MSFCLTRLRMLGVNLLSRTAIGVVRLLVRSATDVVAEFLAPRQLPLSHVRSVRICVVHPAALIIQEAYAKSLRPLHQERGLYGHRDVESSIDHHRYVPGGRIRLQARP